LTEEEQKSSMEAVLTTLSGRLWFEGWLLEFWGLLEWAGRELDRFHSMVL